MDQYTWAGTACVAQFLSSAVKVGYIACLFLGLSISPHALLVFLVVLGAAELWLFFERILAFHKHEKKWEGMKCLLFSFIALFPSALFIVGIYLNIPLLVAIGVGLACVANFFGLIFLIARTDFLAKKTWGNRLFLRIVTSIVLLVSVSLYGVSIAAIFHIAPLSLPLAIVCLTLLGIGAFIRTLSEGVRVVYFHYDCAKFDPILHTSSASSLAMVETVILERLDSANLGPDIKFKETVQGDCSPP